MCDTPAMWPRVWPDRLTFTTIMVQMRDSDTSVPPCALPRLDECREELNKYVGYLEQVTPPTQHNLPSTRHHPPFLQVRNLSSDEVRFRMLWVDCKQVWGPGPGASDRCDGKQVT